MPVVFIFIFLTAIVLISGIILMAVGDQNGKLKSRLMFLRVAFQGVALLLLFMVYLWH